MIPIMASPSVRSSRETTDKLTKPLVVAADNKQCNCPFSVLSYVDGVILLVPMEQISFTVE